MRSLGNSGFTPRFVDWELAVRCRVCFNTLHKERDVQRRSIRLHALLALLLGVFALGLTACGSSDSDSDTGTSASGAATAAATSESSTTDADAGGEVTPVSIALYPSTDYAALYAGINAGIFKKHGLDPQITQVLTGSGITAAITSGKADLGTNSVTSMSTAISNGVPVKLVTATDAMPTEGYVDVLVRKDSGINDFGDLAGKTVATINLQGLFELGVRNAVQKEGGDPMSIKALAMAPTDEAAALKAGRVDAIVLQDPFVAIAKEDPDFKSLGNPFGLLDYQILSGALFASDQMISEKPELMKQFQAAMAESTELVNGDEQLARDAIPTYTELKPDVAATIGLPDYTVDSPEDSINPMLQQMKEYGWIKSVPAYDDIVWDGS